MTHLMLSPHLAKVGSRTIGGLSGADKAGPFCLASDLPSFLEGKNRCINTCKMSSFVRKDMFLLAGLVNSQHAGGGRGQTDTQVLQRVSTQRASPFPRSQPCTLR